MRFSLLLAATALLVGGCSSDSGSDFTMLNPDVKSDATLAVDISPAMK